MKNSTQRPMSERRDLGLKDRGMRLLPVLLVVLSMALWGCRSGSDTAGTPPPQAGDPGTGKAVLGSLVGGAITAEAGDGTLVTLDIPGGALDRSQEITLTVTAGPAVSPRTAKSVNTDVGLTIQIEPALLLLASAQLTIIFPEGHDGGMVLCRVDGERFALKQGMASNTLTGTVYALGEFSCLRPDVDTLIGSAYQLINETPSGLWQDAFAVFDALVWLSDYFARQGYPIEAVDCVAAVVETSRNSAEAFLASVNQIEKGGSDAIAVDMYRRLMGLCENPDNIISQLNALIPMSD